MGSGGSVMTIEKTTIVDLLTLSGITYQAIIYEGKVSGEENGCGFALDSASVVSVNSALVAIPLVCSREGIVNLFDQIVERLDGVIVIKNGIKQDSLTFGMYNNECCPDEGFTINTRINLVTVDASASSPQKITTSTVNPIQNVCCFSTPCGQALVRDVFHAPDYNIQAQNTNKLNQREVWSYIPNFDLAFHRLPKVNCDSSEESCDRKRCKRCKKRKRGKKKCPTTTQKDLSLLLSDIYSISRAVQLDLKPSLVGIAEIERKWRKFEKFEVFPNLSTKFIDVEGLSGFLLMHVEYRLKSEDVIVSMSLSSSLTELEDTRKPILYFNVSTVPITPDLPEPNHAYNKSILQFNETPPLVLF